MRLEGPYGGGNQDWYKFEVAVMIGAGIYLNVFKLKFDHKVTIVN